MNGESQCAGQSTTRTHCSCLQLSCFRKAVDFMELHIFLAQLLRTGLLK